MLQDFPAQELIVQPSWKCSPANCFFASDRSLYRLDLLLFPNKVRRIYPATHSISDVGHCAQCNVRWGVVKSTNYVVKSNLAVSDAWPGDQYRSLKSLGVSGTKERYFSRPPIYDKCFMEVIFQEPAKSGSCACHITSSLPGYAIWKQHKVNFTILI